MPTIYISDAARDFPALLAQVRAGAEIIIESNANPIAILHAAPTPRRSISESIALAEAPSKERGRSPAMDSAFAADMEDILRARKSRDTSP